MRFSTKIISFFLLLLMTHLSLQAVIVPVGQGGYETQLPQGSHGPSDQNGQPVLPKASSSFALPPKTNTWWSSLIWQNSPEEPWSQNLFAHPLAFHAQAKGLGLGYPTQVTVSPYGTTSHGIKVHEYHYPYAEDLLVSVNGLNASATQVDSYSDWAVTSVWQANGRKLQATIGKGFPFAYFTSQGDKVQIQCAENPQIWANSNGVLGLTVKGRNYGIFGPQTASWTTGQTLISDLNGKGYFSIAALPDNTKQTLDFFRAHAYAFIDDTSVDWFYDDVAGTLKTTFTAHTILKETGIGIVNRPLMALYRHQWLNTTQALTSYAYVSPRGVMRVVDASSFSTTLPVCGVLPELPFVAKDGIDTFSKAKLYQYVDDIFKQTPLERWNHLSVGDTYWEGKAMAKVSHLLQAADQVGHTEAKNLFLKELKARLEGWLAASGQQLFYYDTTWKTLIGFPASYGSDTQLNDHHFHYGYFLQAAAAVAQFDPQWARPEAWGGMIAMLIKDVSNWDRNDETFPFLRSYDPYEGHAWANGPALFGSGNNQESSSESTHYSSSLILWGSLTGNKVLRDLGVYLYNTEISAIFQYWFDVDKAVFPQGFPEPTLGILWGSGGAYAIWWDGTIDELHGINFLPIHGGSLYLGTHPDYLKTNEDYILSHGGDKGTWKDIHLGVKALYSPSLAISQFNANPNYAVEAGESRAHTYQWIHNLNQLGLLNPTISANIPTAAVFEINGKRVYTAFNPTSASMTVHFSDGFDFVVPALKILSSDTSVSPQKPYSVNIVLLSGSEVEFQLQLAKKASFADLHYKINNGPQLNVRMIEKNGTWSYAVRNLKPGDQVSYSFTYFTDVGYDIGWQTYKHS